MQIGCPGVVLVQSMFPFLANLIIATAALSGAGNEPGASSYLHAFQPGTDGVIATRPEVYVPQPGDLILFDDRNPTWIKLYHYVGSDMPDHSGIVIKLPDGRPAFLESAPDDGHLAGLYVRILHALPRLHQFKGTIYVRRLKVPLTPEQSDKLTEFAFAQEGKKYAIWRMLLQGTWFRCRSGWRAKYFAETDMNRNRWLCSEIVVAAGTAAGLFDPNTHKANRIYPRDLIYDDHYDLSHTWYEAWVWGPTPERPSCDPPKLDPWPELP